MAADYVTITNLRGPAARITSASANTVPADQPADVTMTGEDQNRGFEFDIPRGLPGVNAVPSDEAVATYLAAPDTETSAAAKTVISQVALTEVVTGAGGSTGANITLGSVANRQGSAIASDVAVSVLLNGGAGAGQNNIIGGNGSTTVGTATPNTTTAGTNASVSVVGGYDNVAGSLSSKIISDHSYTEVGGPGHNAIYGGAQLIARSAAGFSFVTGYYNEVGALYTFAAGYQNKARGTGARVAGTNNDVSGVGSSADGSFNTITGSYSNLTGNRGQAAGSYSRADGQYGDARDSWQQAFGAGQWGTENLPGKAQTSVYAVRKETTNDTATPMGVGGSAIGPIIPINSSAVFSAQVIARVANGTDTAAFRVDGLMRRGASGAPVIVGTPTITAVGADSGASTWAVTTVAGGSTGGLNILVKGELSKTIRWVMRLTTTEVGATP